MSSSYYLDDAKSPRKYEGKDVVVTGTLDAANNTIHVQKIEAAVLVTLAQQTGGFSRGRALPILLSFVKKSAVTCGPQRAGLFFA